MGLSTNFANVDWFDLGSGVNFVYSSRGEDITITIYSKQRQQRHNLHNLLISSTPRSSILQQTYSRRNYTPTLTFFYKKNYSPPSTTTIALAFKSLPSFLDALASLDFKLSVSQSVTYRFSTASASTGLSDFSDDLYVSRILMKA